MYLRPDTKEEDLQLFLGNNVTCMCIACMELLPEAREAAVATAHDGFHNEKDLSNGVGNEFGTGRLYRQEHDHMRDVAQNSALQLSGEDNSGKRQRDGNDAEHDESRR